MSIFWYPDDLSVDTALASLGRMSSTEKRALDAVSDHSHEPLFIGSVAAAMPVVFFLACRKLSCLAGRISPVSLLLFYHKSDVDNITFHHSG